MYAPARKITEKLTEVPYPSFSQIPDEHHPNEPQISEIETQEGIDKEIGLLVNQAGKKINDFNNALHILNQIMQPLYRKSSRIFPDKISTTELFHYATKYYTYSEKSEPTDITITYYIEGSLEDLLKTKISIECINITTEPLPDRPLASSLEIAYALLTTPITTLKHLTKTATLKRRIKKHIKHNKQKLLSQLEHQLHAEIVQRREQIRPLLPSDKPIQDQLLRALLSGKITLYPKHNTTKH